MRAIYINNRDRQCGRCHKTLTWQCGFVGKTAHPIVCFSCVWVWKTPSGWMGLYLDAVESAVRHQFPDALEYYDDDVPF